MNGLEAVAAIEPAAPGAALALSAPPRSEPVLAGGETFAQLLSRGISNAEAKIDRANELVRAFALDDSVPLHEVTIAMEEARLAVELTAQIRTRIVDAYREIMNMQL